MIILRKLRLLQKIFRRDPMPSKKDRFELDVNIMKKPGVTSKRVVQMTPAFQKEYKTLLPQDKRIVDNFKKNVKQGYLYEDGPEGGDTHILGDFSSNKRKFHRLSKKVNDEDRFNYIVHEPELNLLEDGTYSYTQKIVLETCKKHKIYGGKKY